MLGKIRSAAYLTKSMPLATSNRALERKHFIAIEDVQTERPAACARRPPRDLPLEPAAVRNQLLQQARARTAFWNYIRVAQACARDMVKNASPARSLAREEWSPRPKSWR
jgi:hypothetical protein